MMELNIQLFASTNKTANYELPQFVGTDKPTWLGDFNSAMSDIDTGMHTNATAISTMQSDVATATSTASQASQAVSSLTSTVSSLSSDVQSATTTANNASSTASSALNTANSANSLASTANTTANTANAKATEVETNLNSFESKFNLTNTKTYNASSSDISVSGGSVYSGSVTIARDSSNSIFKIYGNLNIKGTSNQFRITLNNTGLTTDSDYNIACVGIADTGSLQPVGIDVKNNQIVIGTYIQSTSTTTIRTMVLFPCVYFNTDFGDTPVGE